MSAPSRAQLVSQGSFSLELPQNRRRKEEDGVDDGLPASLPAVVAVAGEKPELLHQYSGVPDQRSPPVVVDSGVVHDLIHVNCTPMPGVAQPGSRLIATIFYGERHKPDSGVGETVTTTATKEGSELLENPAPISLELPATDAEMPHDKLYGAYVSPICIAAFLHLMSTFPHRPTSVAGTNGGNDGSSGDVGNRRATAAYANGYGSNLLASHRHLDRAVQPRVVEVVLSPVPALALADLRRHEQLYRFEREWGVEVVLQEDTLWRRHPRLVVFDMDSTLITQEVIDMLAEAVTPDVAAQVAEITHRAMQGELPFDAAFQERVRLLAGLPATFFDALRARLNLTEGVPALVRALRRLGVKTAVLSGGFQPLTGWLAEQLCIDYAHANHVVIGDDGRLTGEVTGAIVGRERKRELLLQIAAAEGVSLRQVVAVGDGANDLLMLAEAGLGVAWHAKPVLQLAADARLNTSSLLDLLYLVGFTSTEIAELAAEETAAKVPVKEA